MKDLLQFYNVPIIIIIVCMEIKKVGIIRMLDNRVVYSVYH